MSLHEPHVAPHGETGNLPTGSLPSWDPSLAYGAPLIDSAGQEDGGSYQISLGAACAPPPWDLDLGAKQK